MPEGPSIVILKDAVAGFAAKRVIDATGYDPKFDYSALRGKTIREFRSWGKHFLVCFDDLTVRIHFGLFGTYKVNARGKANAKLTLHFADGEINFYVCQLKQITDDLNKVYDWSADIMSERWDPRKAVKRLREQPDTMICDALLDQDVFAGSGNIIKTEALFRAKLHPENRIGDIPAAKLREIVTKTSEYSFDFLEWRKKGVLKRHWEAYHKQVCPRDAHEIIRKITGKTRRDSFFCPHCQRLYSP